MQRVRIGLTGLAVVFLFVLFCAAVFGLAGQQLAGDDNATVQPGADARVTTGDAPKEPLAEMGVAPGNAPIPGVSGNEAASSPPAPAAVPSRPAAPAR